MGGKETNMKTKRVRCCCVMLPSGSYNIIGWGSSHFDGPATSVHSLASKNMDGITTVTWIEADIEVPELPAERTVEGTVTT